MRCATEIVECLRDQRFQLAFQPLVNATDGTVACHEALLRMRDSGGELVAAGHLVPVAEQLGLIRLVDRAVTQLALDTLHRYPAARLSINLSATTANDPRWNSQIIDMIEAAGRLAERLTLEITETTALADLTSAITFLERLRATGCGVAIDDFGAGFTSFRNLRDLPIDVIKLDGSYCCNLTQDPENVYFARTLIDMAHHFGIRTVAEWVETQQDAEVLASLGIDFLQGHYLGEPSVVAPWPEAERSAFDFDSHAQGIAPVTLTATPLQPVAPVVEPPAIPSVMPSVMEEAASGVVFTEVPADLAIEMLVEELAADEPVSDATLAIESPADEVPLPSAEESFAFVEQVHSLSAVDSEEQAAAPADGDISMFDELEESLARLRQTLHLLGQTTEPAAQRLAG
ncbi:MAG: EAL domain-containing protein [Hyphomicrobiales bacterium]